MRLRVSLRPGVCLRLRADSRLFLGVGFARCGLVLVEFHFSNVRRENSYINKGF